MPVTATVVALPTTHLGTSSFALRVGRAFVAVRQTKHRIRHLSPKRLVIQELLEQLRTAGARPVSRDICGPALAEKGHEYIEVADVPGWREYEFPELKGRLRQHR